MAVFCFKDYANLNRDQLYKQQNTKPSTMFANLANCTELQILSSVIQKKTKVIGFNTLLRSPKCSETDTTLFPHS